LLSLSKNRYIIFVASNQKQVNKNKFVIDEWNMNYCTDSACSNDVKGVSTRTLPDNVFTISEVYLYHHHHHHYHGTYNVLAQVPVAAG